MTSTDRQHTAAVVGGGPAGLVAAEVLAQSGLGVTVYEHMASVGRKFILAGRGGLNITHSEPPEAFLDRYGPHRTHLEPALERFGPDDLRAWCAGLDEATFVGSSGRVFPESFKSTPLLRAWLERLGALNVAFEVRHRWLGFGAGLDNEVDGRHLRFENVEGNVVHVATDVTVLALGGASWPRVGSDGGWVEEFARCGIEVSPLRPANCGVRVDWADHLLDRFGGVPLKNIAVTVGDNRVRGDAMITSSGLEGGPIYAQSAGIRSQLDRHQRCDVALDLHPDLTTQRLAERLEQRRRPKDSRSTWLRRSGLDRAATAVLAHAMGGNVPTDPSELAAAVKSVPLTVASLMPIERAISTAGGVAFGEVDAAFMLRKLPGVFVAGEMLDWEAPTGGYLLQASFSTAVAAAKGAIAWVDQAGTSSM